MSRRVADFTTYIRYNNIRFALTEVKEGELYRWENNYPVWNRLIEIFKNTGINHNVLPVEIDEEEYVLASNRLLKDLDDLITDQDINDDNLSFFYVRATIAAAIGHPDKEGWLDRLYRYAASNVYVHREMDICLILAKLSHLKTNDVFEFTSKAKKWLFTLGNLRQNHDVAAVKANIYLLLICITSEENKKAEFYRNNCKEQIRSLSTETHSQRLERIELKYWYIQLSDISETKTFSSLIVDLWYDIIKELSYCYDPRIAKVYIDTFLMGASYLMEYGVFGISLPFITAGIYLWVRKEGITQSQTYLSLLNALEVFLTDSDEEFAMQMMKIHGIYDPVKVRLKILAAQDSYCPNDYRTKLKIARGLLEIGKINESVKYAETALSLTHPDNIYNPTEIIDYIDTRLFLVEPYFMLGRWNDADEIINDSSFRISRLAALYDEDNGIYLGNVIGRYDDLLDEMRRHPYLKREMRLEYLIETIRGMKCAPQDLASFYEKWKQFYCGYRFHREIFDKDLIAEFENDDFISKLEQVSTMVETNKDKFEIIPLKDEDVEELGDKLGWAYEKWQQSFIANDVDVSAIDTSKKVQYPEPNDLFLFFEVLSKNQCR